MNFLNELEREAPAPVPQLEPDEPFILQMVLRAGDGPVEPQDAVEVKEHHARLFASKTGGEIERRRGQLERIEARTETATREARRLTEAIAAKDPTVLSAPAAEDNARALPWTWVARAKVALLIAMGLALLAGQWVLQQNLIALSGLLEDLEPWGKGLFTLVLLLASFALKGGIELVSSDTMRRRLDLCLAMGAALLAPVATVLFAMTFSSHAVESTESLIAGILDEENRSAGHGYITAFTISALLCEMLIAALCWRLVSREFASHNRYRPAPNPDVIVLKELLEAQLSELDRLAAARAKIAARLNDLESALAVLCERAAAQHEALLVGRRSGYEIWQRALERSSVNPQPPHHPRFSTDHHSNNGVLP